MSASDRYQSRRGFLAAVGRSMLTATVGWEVAGDLGSIPSWAASPSEDRLLFGDLEPLVAKMQDTPADGLLPMLAAELRAGIPLNRLVAAGALANARTFGGEDYVGFHTGMAMAPAYHMARELPETSSPLPVFKVLYRNTRRIQEVGGASHEVLRPIPDPGPPVTRGQPGEVIRESVRRKDVRTAERRLAACGQHSFQYALAAALPAVHDDAEVHRVVLPYRAWDLLDIIGHQHAVTLLRQSVRYCVQAEDWKRTGVRGELRTLLPQFLEEHRLLERSPGNRPAEDSWVQELAKTLFTTTPSQAASAAAAALAEGIDPAAVGEAISLAANQLLLRDHGRTPTEEVPGKPIGSVHGDSIGVHACDSANAWRHLAQAGDPHNTFSCLILGAFQVALDRTARGGDFLHWQSLPVTRHLGEIKTNDSTELLRQADEAIRSNLQATASAVVHRYGELGFPERPLFDLLLHYAVSEDGSLHGEKFYRTVVEEFAETRPAFRWRHLVALARVTASEYGKPAPGMAEARALLKLA